MISSVIEVESVVEVAECVAEVVEGATVAVKVVVAVAPVKVVVDDSGMIAHCPCEFHKRQSRR